MHCIYVMHFNLYVFNDYFKFTFMNFESKISYNFFHKKMKQCYCTFEHKYVIP